MERTGEVLLKKMVDTEILLTVVVTVYNVEQYIDKCIGSIRRQTYENLEIIIIDDGSTDHSGIICDKYAAEDKRIQVMHKRNEGLVSARYQGTQLATGSVLAFVDGDDWIDPDMYECMVRAYKNEKTDLITSGMVWDWGEKAELLLDGIPEGIYGKEVIFDKVLPNAMFDGSTKQQGITASVCNKLFDCALLKTLVYRMDPQLTLGEDGALIYLFVAYAKKIRIIHKAWYHYVQHENSMIRTNGWDTFEKLYRLENCLLDNFKCLGIEKKMKPQIDCYVKRFLQRLLEDIYKIEWNAITYVFPYERIPRGSKIILYGAGKVGRSFQRCLMYGHYAEVASWVDKDYMRLREEGLSVESLEEALINHYDYIVIAIEDEEAAKEIQSLLLDYNIKREKIIWEKRNKVF